MPQSSYTRVVVAGLLAVSVAASLNVWPVGAAHGQQGRAAVCAVGDTSGSCRLQTSTMMIRSQTCTGGKTACRPVMIHLRKDANHPYDLIVQLPIVPKGSKASGNQLGAGASVSLALDPSGQFALRVTDRQGLRLAVWSPALRLIPPGGYRTLQRLGRHGWLRVNATTVQQPGLYRWIV